MFLRVSMMKGIQRFGVRGKLAPRYVGSFPIIQKIGPVAYRVQLPASLESVHDVFHVSNLIKYIHDPNHVIIIEEL